MIEAKDLTRRYGDFTAVEGVSFTVADGEILGILGPNGAGKTTTLRMITGYLPPSAGRVTVNGHDLLEHPDRAKRELGYLPEHVALYNEMRVREYLSFRGRLQGMARGAMADAIDEVLERCLLSDVEGQIIGTLSKGYRQRVGLAASILHGPRVLVLDEPTVGLDPKQIIAIRELIRELGQERTLLLSSHILPEVEQLCDRVLIIDRGRLVADGTPSELRQRALGHSLLRLEIKDAPDEALQHLGGLPGVEESQRMDGTDLFQLSCASDQDVREDAFRLAVEKGWILLELSEKKASLEDVFVRLTGRDALDDVQDDVGDKTVKDKTVKDETVEDKTVGDKTEEPSEGTKEEAS